MQINRVSPVSFGYSKRSQNWLEENAKESDNKRFAVDLVACSKICNIMEDEITRVETKNGDAASEPDLVDLFVSVKSAVITGALALFDDSDKYLKSEYNYYSRALNRRDDKEKNWRAKIIEQLTFWDLTLGKSKDELESELNKAKEYKAVAQKQVTDILKTYGEQKDTNPKVSAKTTESSPIIERLQKTEFSPDGFKDVMGMEKLKSQLKEDIIDPVNDPELAKLDYEEYGKRMPSGVLLFGPPGCGKTYIIEALAGEIDSNVYIMNSANTGSKYVNQTANNIKSAFEYVYKKGESSNKPVLMFLDEMDAMTNRSGHTSSEDVKGVATLLKYIEDAKAHNVIVIGATNRYDMVDPAIRRRFDVKKYVGLPDIDQRTQLLKNNLKNKKKGQKLLADDETLQKVAHSLEGYSNHSVNIIADDAALNALRRNRSDIEYKDFELAIKETDEEKIDERQYTPKSKKPPIGFGKND